MCISFKAISEVTLVTGDPATYDVKWKDVTYTNIIRSCGPAVPGKPIDETCQYYQGLIPNSNAGFSGEETSTCNIGHARRISATRMRTQIFPDL